MPAAVRSFSKINLGLAIGPTRADGFHALTTCYQTLEAHDLVTVDARPAPATSIRLTSDHARVPADARNTAWKMVERALAIRQFHAEVSVHIAKRLPVQGGLGAGSANAVAALIGLEMELSRYGVPLLAGPEKLRIAAEVGSDVPLFLVGGAVLGTGRGEQVAPLPDFPPTECVVALPDVGVSTPQAFRDWDELQCSAVNAPLSAGSETGAFDPAEAGGGAGDGLTEPPASDRLNLLSRALLSAFAPGEDTHSSGVSVLGGGLAGKGNPLLALVRTGIENDFEQVVFRQYPHLGTIKRLLAASAPREEFVSYAALSGSGSALFGLYATPEASTAAEARLSAAGIRSLRTKTLPRDAYWGTMVEQDGD